MDSIVTDFECRICLKICRCFMFTWTWWYFVA